MTLPEIDFPEDDTLAAWRRCLAGHHALLHALDTAPQPKTFIAELLDVASQSGAKIFEELLMAQVGRMVSIGGEDETRRRIASILDERFWEISRRASSMAAAATPLMTEMLRAEKKGPS